METKMSSSFLDQKVKHVISVKQFDSEFVNLLFNEAREMKKVVMDFKKKIINQPEMENYTKRWGTKGKGIIIFFYEKSTRTIGSFSAAINFLGGSVILTVSNAKDSSVGKNESLKDTIRTLAGYLPDAIVLRHSETGAAQKAAEASLEVPIINAGDGRGEHPTQTLLDIFTMCEVFGIEEFKELDRLKIAIVGDVANSRAARSLSFFLGKFYKDVKIYYASPEPLRVDSDIKDYLSEQGIKFFEVDSLFELPSDINVIYQNRNKKDRWQDLGIKINYEEIRDRFAIDKKMLSRFSLDTKIMDPMPRDEQDKEIDPEIDDDPQAIYFPESDNGPFVRMALFKIVFD